VHLGERECSQRRYQKIIEEAFHRLASKAITAQIRARSSMIMFEFAVES